MRIITKSRKSKPESMFIFEFATKSEFNDIISTIRNMVSLCSESEAKSINSLLDKIESRTDSKYSHDGCELSGFLFANEFADFTEQVIYWPCIADGTKKKQKARIRITAMDFLIY